MASSSTFVSAFLLSYLAAATIGAAAASTADIDFQYLVLMWPGAYCKQSNNGCCYPETGKPELDFYVSALWPASSDGSPLSYCNKIPFHIKEVSDIKESLISYWPSIKCPSSGGRFVWKNTWNEYGVCSGLNVHDYFKKALDLRAKIDLLSILKNNGITSTDYADYSLSEVTKAINNGVGANTGIDCAKNAWDESIIYEVYICVNKDATKIVSCPHFENSCASRVVFGSFTYDMLQKDVSVTKNPIRARVSLQ
ncbi:hypothetical protein QJS10_CPB12g00918 [Acorus calamus]|uniref:Uncharacterized protein n=1 Tax=Acorus calamus TaxID=4465 RepID=A0AAV9DP11_ACOCL|nr:hypothetical protein QJS10_CPB12g00918 [Acorus calamus]